MPRYAKGSLNDMIYGDLIAMANDEAAQMALHRANSKGSRAHRHETGNAGVELQQPPTAIKLRAVRNILNIYESYLCTDESAWLMIQDILSE